MIYLASPYSHKLASVRASRAHAARQAVYKLALSGSVVYSPIAHWHQIACEYELPTDFAFWRHQDLGILRHCDQLLVLGIEGWDESKGVAMEMAFAGNHGISIAHLEP